MCNERTLHHPVVEECSYKTAHSVQESADAEPQSCEAEAA